MAAMSDVKDNSASMTAELGDGEVNVTPQGIIEALVFSADSPLPARKIAQILGVGNANDVKEHIQCLNEQYEQQQRSFRIEHIAKGYQILTAPEFHTWVKKLHKVREESRLSSAALETLAIVAYKQPVLRVGIEAIRGVAVGDMLVRLREMKLVKIVGRAEEIGRPLLYGTTNRFLDVFGLSSLTDLPKLDQDDPTAVPTLKPAVEEPGDAGQPSSDDDAAQASLDDTTEPISDDTAKPASDEV